MRNHRLWLTEDAQRNDFRLHKQNPQPAPKAGAGFVGGWCIANMNTKPSQLSFDLPPAQAKHLAPRDSGTEKPDASARALADPLVEKFMRTFDAQIIEVTDFRPERA